MKPFVCCAVVLLVAASASFAQVAVGQPKTTDTRAFATPPDKADDYVLGPNDKLEIKFFEQEQLDRHVRITPDGTISLPLLGEVHIGGLTPRQAEEAIAKEYRDREFLKNPQVSVFVEEYVSRRVYVQGAVHQPGLIDLIGDRTLLDVLGQVGGLNENADRRIIVNRPFAKPGEERVVVDAQKLFYDGDPLANMQVQPGDIITVPFQQEYHVYVNGAVRNPGEVKYKSWESLTILQAVTAAGGGNDRANESKVQVIRKLENGTQRVFKVNLKKVKRGKAEDMVLERNDVVYVPESFF